MHRGLKDRFRSAAIEVGCAMIEQGAYYLKRADVIASTPWGDGHPVLIEPGLFMGKWHVAPVCDLLQEKAYRPYIKDCRFITGANERNLRRTEEKLFEIAAENPGRKISLVTESIGALNATLLAFMHPHLVRDITMFGAPLHFSDPGAIAPAFRKLHQIINPEKNIDDAELAEMIVKGPKGIPRTSIYMSHDQVVNWRASILDPRAPMTQNIKVYGSHINAVHNPMVHVPLLDALSQKPDQTWQSFKPEKYARMLFPDQTTEEHQHGIATSRFAKR